MPHTWTKEEVSSWADGRDKERRKLGLLPFDQLDEKEKKSALAMQRTELLQLTKLKLMMQAWAVNRYPLSAYHAPRSGVLDLPRHYHAILGSDQVKFKKGDDLNSLTYQHYDEFVDPDTYSGSNFVTDIAIHPKRHEYLGPAPKVVDYRFRDDVVEICFWDEHLKTPWTGKRRWEVEVEFDPVVESWFVVEYN